MPMIADSPECRVAVASAGDFDHAVIWMDVAFSDLKANRRQDAVGQFGRPRTLTHQSTFRISRAGHEIAVSGESLPPRF